NEVIRIEDIVAEIELDLTGDISWVASLIDSFDGHADHFNLAAHGERKNAVGSVVSPITSTPHDESGEFVSFTVNGNDTVFTAGEEDVEIKGDEILAQIETGIVGDIPATCTPNGDSVLATVTVEDPEPE